MSSNELTDIQKAIVEADLGPMLVTAGAGSGKTRVLTHRLVHIIRNGIPDTAIIALTFTNKAANEMKRRVEEMLAVETKVEKSICNAFLGTFHSFCTRFLRRNIQHLENYNSNFSIYNTTDTQKIIKEIIAENNFVKPEKEKDNHKIFEWHLSNMKNTGASIEEYRASITGDENCDDIMRVICAYEKRLSSHNALDFDDLLVKVLEIFERCPDILAKMQQQFQYILVDEFQDTNTIQYKIVSRLAAVHKNIMCVGDEDQCIYTWRGASIENIAQFRKDFPATRVYKLEENFRSSKNIVNLANKLVSHNINRLSKVLFSALPDGIISLESCYNEREEAHKVATTIVDLMRRGDGSLRYGDFAVLMRINALSRHFEEQFLTYNIPHIIWGGFKFYERAEIKSVINYFRVLVNPRDEIALLDVVNYPRRGVGDTSCETLKALALKNNKTVYDIIMNIDIYMKEFTQRALGGIKEFVAVMNTLIELHNSFGLMDLAGSFISTIGLDRSLKESKKEDDINRLENIYQLENAVKSFAAENPSATLAQYLQSVSLVSDADSPSPEDSVIISTIHSAKGLEFKNVFIVGLEDGLFPLNRSKNSESEMEEERRLLYVAITRARERLALSYCGRRFLRGETAECLPSLFLKEAGFEIKKQSFDFEDMDESGSGEYRKYSRYESGHGGHSHGGGYERGRWNGQSRDNAKSNWFGNKKGVGGINEPKANPSFEPPAPKSDTAEKLGFEVGGRVRHEKFGEGEILEIIDKNIIKIKFDIAGVKMLSLAFAVLETI